jgi:hypothetical protein
MYKYVYISENEYKKKDEEAEEEKKPIKDRVSCRITIDITVQKNR